MIKFVGATKLSKNEILDLVGNIKGIIYARVSTNDQVNKYSLTTQVEECIRHAEKSFNYKEEELIACVEEGESGDDPNRPALNNALFLLEQGVGKKLIVLHPDRLSRSLGLQTRVSDKIWGLGCDIEFVQFDLDPNNPESVLMYNIQGSIAQYNKAKILANSKRGRIKKIQEQKLMGVNRMYGYIYDKENDTLVINPEEAEVYRQIVDMLINEDKSMSEIAKELSKNGIMAPKGKVWYQATISKMLRNEAYMGKFYYGRRTLKKQKDGTQKTIHNPVEDWMMVKIPAIINEETFIMVQNKIKTLTKFKTGRPSEHGLVRGVARCGRCGSSVSLSSFSKLKSKTLSYYSCIKKTKKGYLVGSGDVSHHLCKGKNWRVDLVDKYVWEYIIDLLKSPDKLIAEIVSQQGDKEVIENLQKKKDKLLSLMKEKNQSYDRYTDLYAEGIIRSKDDLEKKLSPITEQLNELETEMAIIQDHINVMLVSYDELEIIKQKLSDLHLVLDKDILPAQKKKEVIQNIVKKVVLNDDGGIEIYTTWRRKSVSAEDLQDGIEASNPHTNSFQSQTHGIDFYVDFKGTLPDSKWADESHERRSVTIQEQLDKLVELYHGKLMSLREIEEETGIDWWIVRDLFIQNGIELLGKQEIYKRRRERDYEFLYDLHFNKGITLKQIYKEYKYSPVYVRKVFKEAGVEPIKRNQHGIIHKHE